MQDQVDGLVKLEELKSKRSAQLTESKKEKQERSQKVQELLKEAEKVASQLRPDQQNNQLADALTINYFSKMLTDTIEAMKKYQSLQIQQRITELDEQMAADGADIEQINKEIEQVKKLDKITPLVQKYHDLDLKKRINQTKLNSNPDMPVAEKNRINSNISKIDAEIAKIGTQIGAVTGDDRPIHEQIKEITENSDTLGIQEFYSHKDLADNPDVVATIKEANFNSFDPDPAQISDTDIEIIDQVKQHLKEKITTNIEQGISKQADALELAKQLDKTTPEQVKV